MVAPGECYEPENKRKCTEPERERMSGELMELNDTELNYLNFGDKTDYNNMIPMKNLCFKKDCFILKQFSIVRKNNLLLKIISSERPFE